MKTPVPAVINAVEGPSAPSPASTPFPSAPPSLNPSPALRPSHALRPAPSAVTLVVPDGSYQAGKGGPVLSKSEQQEAVVRELSAAMDRESTPLIAASGSAAAKSNYALLGRLEAERSSGNMSRIKKTASFRTVDTLVRRTDSGAGMERVTSALVRTSSRTARSAGNGDRAMDGLREARARKLIEKSLSTAGATAASNLTFSREFLRVLWWQGLAVALVITALLLDVYATKSITGSQIWGSLWPTKAAVAVESLVGFSEVIALHLRIVFTVAILAVQVSMIRFTPLIATDFFKNPIIMWTIISYICVTVAVMICKYFTSATYVPTLLIVLCALLIMCVYAFLVPYFTFILRTLEPRQVIRSITDQAMLSMDPSIYGKIAAKGRKTSKKLQASASSASVMGAGSTANLRRNASVSGAGNEIGEVIEEEERLARERGAMVEERARHALRSLEQLKDFGIKALLFHDRLIAANVCHALARILEVYGQVQSSFPEEWDTVPSLLRDLEVGFKGTDPALIVEIETSGLWLEWKVLKHFETIFLSGLQLGQEVCLLVAVHSRSIAMGAIRSGNVNLLRQVSLYFNRYLDMCTASGVNNSIRVAYNILQQYRDLIVSALLCNSLYDGENGGDLGAFLPQRVQAQFYDHVIKMCVDMASFAVVAVDRKLNYIAQVVAFDLCAICEEAAICNSPCGGDVLSVTVSLLSKITRLVDPFNGRGIQKALARLATLHMQKRDFSSVARIAETLVGGGKEQLVGLFEDLERCDQKEFWEVIDRGTNFDYIPEDRKATLESFFNAMPIFASGEATLPAIHQVH